MKDDLPDLHEGDKTGQWRDFLKQKYRKALGELGREYPFKRSLLIDYKEIERWGPAGIALADELIENPGKCIEDIKDALLQGDFIKTREGVKLKSLALHVRFIHLPKKTRIRDMRTDNVNRFFSCEGMITRISEIRPRMIEAVFRCPAGHFTMVLQKPGKTKEPDGCSTDGCRFRKLDLSPRMIEAVFRCPAGHFTMVLQKPGKTKERMDVQQMDAGSENWIFSRNAQSSSIARMGLFRKAWKASDQENNRENLLLILKTIL